MMSDQLIKLVIWIGKKFPQLALGKKRIPSQKKSLKKREKILDLRQMLIIWGLL